MSKCKYQIWDGKTALNTPAGTRMSVEDVLKEWPWAKDNKAIITKGVINGGVFMALEDVRALYEDQGMEVADNATDEQVVEAIWDWEHREIEMPEDPQVTLANAINRQTTIEEYKLIMNDDL